MVKTRKVLSFIGGFLMMKAVVVRDTRVIWFCLGARLGLCACGTLLNLFRIYLKVVARRVCESVAVPGN